MSFSNSYVRRIAATTFAFAVAAAYVPSAAAAAEPTPADKSSARDAFLAGKDLRAKKDHRGALEKFKLAYALVPSPITALEVGRSLVDVGMLVEGSEKLIEAATMPAKANESADAKKAREEAKQLADEVAARIPSVTINVKNAPSGAAVSLSIDERVVPSESIGSPLKVNPGTHEVSASVEGIAPQRRSVRVKEGETKEVTITLPDTKEPPSKRTKVTESGHVDDTSGGGSGQRTAGIVIGISGVVVGGVGGFLAANGSSAFKSPGDDHGICDAACQSNQASAQTRVRVGWGLAGVGIAAGVTGVVLIVTAPAASDAKPGARASLGISPTGVVLTGEF